MAADPTTLARRQRRFDRYERLSTTPLLINGFIFVGAFLAVLTVPGEAFAPTLVTITWFVFIADYAVMVILAPKRWLWVVTHAHYLVGIVFPPLRVVLLVQVVDRAMRSRNSPVREKVGLTMAYATTVIVVFGAYFVWQFERDAPGANIRTYGESLWWAVVTITTVGYGDYAPVTVGGRIVATVVLCNGIAAIAVLSAVVVSYFSDARRAASPAGAGDPQAPGGQMAAVEQRLAGIEAVLHRHLPSSSPLPSDPAPRLAPADQPADQPAEQGDGGDAAPG